MHLQPNRDYVSNDDVQTPPALARRLVAHFQPRGRILEPCRGDGNFYRALRAFARAQTRLPRKAARPTRGHHRSNPFSPPPPPLDLRRMTHVAWCEHKLGRDFFACHAPVDWIITNPPWSQIRAFLQHAMRLADHVVFLMTINHVWTSARVRDIRSAGFALKEIVLVDMPRIFPQSGFQLGAVHLARGWRGPVTLTDWTAPRLTAPDTRSRNNVSPPQENHGWSPRDLAAFRRWRTKELESI